MIDRLLRLLRKPESRMPSKALLQRSERLKGGDEGSDNITVYVMTPKRSILDRWLDWVVRASGSKFVFFAILAGLLTWALLGIPYGRTRYLAGFSFLMCKPLSASRLFPGASTAQ